MTAPREERLELLLTDLLVAGRNLLKVPTHVGARRQLRAACDRAQAWLKADMAALRAEETEQRRRTPRIEARGQAEPPPLLRARLPYKED